MTAVLKTPTDENHILDLVNMSMLCFYVLQPTSFVHISFFKLSPKFPVALLVYGATLLFDQCISACLVHLGHRIIKTLLKLGKEKLKRKKTKTPNFCNYIHTYCVTQPCSYTCDSRPINMKDWQTDKGSLLIDIGDTIHGIENMGIGIVLYGVRAILNIDRH